jgi:CheY-like chemotaxis protein
VAGAYALRDRIYVKFIGPEIERMDKPFVLIIEDDRDIVALYRQVLDMAGYQTEISLNGKDAMERLPALRPDIILLDLQLPGMSGVEILKRIRADENLRSTPVVVITAYAQFSESLPVEPDLVLLKPVDIHQLSNLVQRLQVTQGNIHESPQDKVTRLYTMPFFKVRLTFAVERIRQRGVLRFGVLFADLDPLETVRKKLHEEEFNRFLRSMADCFKASLRPTDTMAWSEGGYFVTLIDEIRDPQIPVKIATRVGKGMRDFLAQEPANRRMKVNVGILSCDPGYEDAAAIFNDIEFARGLLRKRPDGASGVFDREMLHVQRNF